MRKNLALCFLHASLVLIACQVNAQGWSFSATFTATGPCGAYVPTLPTFSAPFMATQSYCESVRQSILNIRVSQPMYDAHNNYIGDCAVFYTCTPCTGSDMSTSSGGEFGTGSVSIDGLLQGSSFFSPHGSGELENWMNDYRVKLGTMGISHDEINSLSVLNIPLTGDANFDEFYVNELIEFERSEPAPSDQIIGIENSQPGVPVDLSNSSAAESGTSVQLLRSQADIDRENKWLAEHEYFTVNSVGADNMLDAGGNQSSEMSWSEAMVREFVGNNAAGGLALEFVDGTMKGTTEVTQRLANNDLEGAAELGINLSENVARSATTTWAKDQATDFVTGQVTGPVLGLVKGAGMVNTVINTFTNLWDTKHGNE